VSDDSAADAAYAAVRTALSDVPREFDTAAGLIEILSRLPGGTPVSVGEQLLADPDVDLAGDDWVYTYTVTPRMVLEPVTAAELEYRPVPAVELNAVCAAADRPVSTATVPATPYHRLIEAMGPGDHAAQLAASRDLLGFIADGIDSGDDALIGLLGGDPDLAARALTEAARLREAATRLQNLQAQITEHLRGAHE
jgi:hypothetical protein